MTHDELTKSFRVIDTWVTEARQLFAIGLAEDRREAFGKLAAIQLEAQHGMQATLTDQPKLEACDLILAGPIDEPSIELTGEYHTGLYCGLEDRDICDRYDACDYGFERGVERALEWAYDVVETGLAKAKEQTAPGAEAPRV